MQLQFDMGTDADTEMKKSPRPYLDFIVNIIYVYMICMLHTVYKRVEKYHQQHILKVRPS